MEIRAVGFDVDGTLYPEYMMYIHSLPVFLRSPRLLFQFGRARALLRAETASVPGARARTAPGDAFRTRLAKAVLGMQGKSRPGADPSAVQIMEQLIAERIYKVWEQSYIHVRSYRGVRDVFTVCRDIGLKTGLLSDLPLGSKPEALGVAELTDVFCCSEETGSLKPDAAPFLYLAEKMGCNPDQILYVGNSCSKDIEGAGAVGMKTALIARQVTRKGKAGCPAADVIFSRYAELQTLLTSGRL